MPIPPVPQYRQPAWFTPYSPAKLNTKTGTPENILYSVYSRAMPFLDPETQKATASWMATQDPKKFGKYMSEPWRASPTPTYNPEEYLTAYRLSQALEALTPTGVAEQMSAGRIPPHALGQAWEKFAGPASGPLAWLRAYLRTAEAAMPDAAGLKPRRERYAAMLHLKTLENEAQSNPALIPYLTLAQNLVNPQIDRAPGYSGVGFSRAVVPPVGMSEQYRPRPNPWFT